MAAKNYTEILALVNAGNQMGLSNTIKRDYGIPLDFTSVQPSFDDAVIYAAENTKAYVGQPLSVGGKLYIINDVAAAEKHVVGEKEYDNYLVEVGSATEGDGVTIDLEQGVLTLHGFDSALTGYLPRKAEDGSLEWVPISAVVQGDGNKVTTLTSTDGSVEITKTTDTDDSLVYDLSVTHPDMPEYAVTAGERAEDATSTTYRLTKDGSPVDVAIVVPDAYDDAEISNKLDEVSAILEGIGGENEKATVVEYVNDAVDTAVQSVLGEGVEEAYNTLKEIQDILQGTDGEAIDGLIETVDANKTAIGVLNGVGEGSVAKSIADAETRVANTYATKQSVTDLGNTVTATLNDYAKTSDVAEELAKKIDRATIAHSTDEKAEGATVTGTQLDIVVDAFTKAETRQYVADTIKTMTGGESAADVKLLLENHIADYTEKVGQIDAKDTAQDALITAAKEQADKGVADAKTANDAIAALTSGAVATNTSDITAIKGRLTTLETAKGDHEARIASAEGKITALEAEDTKINSAIGIIQGNITTLQGEDSRLGGLIESLQTTKADASSVYTKSETDKKIGDAIAAIPAVDFTPYATNEYVNAELAKKVDTTTLADYYTKTDADAAFMTESEVDARINALIVAADPEGGKTITDIQNLVKYVDENAGEIAELITATNANTSKLAGIETTVTAAIDAAIAAIVMPKASEEVTLAADGTLGLGKVSTDKLEMGNDILVINGGSAV